MSCFLPQIYFFALPKVWATFELGTPPSSQSEFFTFSRRQPLSHKRPPPTHKPRPPSSPHLHRVSARPVPWLQARPPPLVPPSSQCSCPVSQLSSPAIFSAHSLQSDSFLPLLCCPECPGPMTQDYSNNVPRPEPVPPSPVPLRFTLCTSARSILINSLSTDLSVQCMKDRWVQY